MPVPMTDRATVPDERKSRNRAFLIARFPDLAPVLSTPTTVAPVCEDGEVIDIDLGPGRLYGANGKTLAVDQVAGYMEKPLRFFITDLAGTNISSKVSFQLFNHLMGELKTNGLTIDDLEAKPRYEGCFLIVLGLGLGYHLSDLIDRTGAKIVFIIEPHPEFLRHSLDSVDWCDLIGRNEEQGCKFSIVVPPTAADAVRLISNHFTSEGSHFIDGAYVFMHYPSATLFDIRDRLVEQVQVLYSSRGFHEDELIMLTNAAANLALGKFRLLDNKLRPERHEPVFIIASGPSIDQSIEHIKRMRENAIVFSCGTGLRVCLSNGIIPDFHCEIENGENVFKALSLVRDQFSFKGITLIGSLTVDQRVPALFDDVVLFFRDGVAGSRVLTDHDNEIYLAVPTVTNTAVRTALALGFGTLYLFGVDCGTKDLAKKHSRQSIYFHTEVFKDPYTELTFSCQGNFGGLVKSTWLLMFTRMMVSEVCRTFQPKIYNCSDGAEIRYTVPKVVESVTLPALRYRREQIKSTILHHLRPCEPKALLSEISFAHLKEEVEAFRRDGLAAIDAAAEGEPNFVAFWKKLDPFFKDRTTTYSQIPSMIDCSLKSLPKIGMFFIHRIRDNDIRVDLYSSFIGEYRNIFMQMCDNVAGCLNLLIEEHGL